MAGENTKVHFKQGGDELVVASGGKITGEPGALIGGVDFGVMPTADPEDGVTIWNDGGVLKMASAPG